VRCVARDSWNECGSEAARSCGADSGSTFTHVSESVIGRAVHVAECVPLNVYAGGSRFGSLE
jgi:hypothetical protein